ncbi:preprotein translocase subunit SecA [Longicatena sp. 210702-DFI.1.36]|uniref:preprotein translocase subunit SecA n=1 Tax=Longicatena TaxID=1918536 RepID=UPI001D0799AC|nr:MULTISPECIES: preprotein translocase subunit SecA [Longicatena]MCB6264284.1 preprotein translocase subunit SecA [Longicatena sp. 210702-DFI.1.160]MCB6314869.1 preprotein translocase subunit SecA [Longicatena sp. 210702-DFI.1.100]MCB6430471.1 preprotein translocase subunit SecA [Longicatena sp. 210702-DFI.1.36]MCB6433525.1 preprotein translocase subunit SecA [Longicatena sp. 210702-DFI.1.249]MCB6440033.1 preprotein translocase subunit SecA [Longicatena sp. 210702-DFI.1.255]
MANFIERLLNGEKKTLHKLEKIADAVIALQDSMEALSDDELRGKTQEFQERYTKGETLEDLQVEAFAVAREAARRTIGEFPYKVQIMGAAAMHGGDIAEMKTGEGKTLTSTMCVYLNALSGEGVHVVTVNEYLASRDAEWMGQIYRFLGLSVGVNSRPLSPLQKREAYNCDITYTTNSELGFDYLRDNMVTDVKDRVLRGLHVAIVDEVDSILVDESRTPLIISGGAKKTANLYLQADAFAKRLKGDDYEIDEKTRQIMLSEKGVHSAERYFKIKNLYDIEHTQLVHHITQALKANYIMKNEVEYVVQDNEIVIVDTFTGRTMPGRAYSDGLHQAIEAKEGVPIKEETTTLATITYQNFFRLYDKLAGMTGTAKTEEEEFLDIYNMRVIEIPTNRPVIREDYPDAIFANPRLKFNALIEEVKELYAKGQPVLVGTISVEASELVHQLLQKARIPHEVLNAKNHAREAEIIAKAGRPKSVTVATNMAGRGTDIKLTEESKALGGLAVLGSERHESRRIDNQLRGRSGRQGDPGFSRFYVSLKDELMIRFGGEKFKKLFDSLGDAQIESKMVTKSITQAQKRVEGYNYDVRKQLLDYDDVLRKQREIMYEQRNFVLENEDVHGIVRDMIDRVIENVVNANVDTSKREDNVDYDGIRQGLEVLGVAAEDNIKVENLRGKDADETAKYCSDYIFQLYDDKISDIRDEFKQFEKTIVLRNMDRNWIEHIDMMDKLRNGIHLRAYAQNNPLQAYIEEGYEMFEEMQARIAREVVFFAMKVQIERKEA